MKIKIETMYILDELSDNQRLSLILELIHTSSDICELLKLLKQKLETIDKFID